MTIKNVSYEILDKTKPTTDILLRFSDCGLNKEQYASISELLEGFKLDKNSKYSITINTKYDESNKILLIRLIIPIPDGYKPEELDLGKIMTEHVFIFTQFYERISNFISKSNKRGQ